MAVPQRTQHETVGANLRRRVRRLQLRRVERPVLPWVLVTWALTAAAAVTQFWPGSLAGIVGAPVDAADGLTGFAAPLWFRLLITLAGAGVTGAAVVAQLTRRERGIRGELAIAGLVVLPPLTLLADHAWLFALAAGLLALAAEASMRLAFARAVPALLAAGTWLVLLVYQFSPSGALRSSWVWIALFGAAAAFAAFGAYYGVARAAESRSRGVRFLFTRRWHPLGSLAITLVALALVVLRFTVLRELFPAPDPALWTPWSRSPVSWLLAALVAAVLAVVAVRSARRPLLRVGQRRVTATLAVLGNLHLVIGAALILIGLVMAVRGPVDVPHEWLGAVPVLKVAGVVLLGVAVVLPVFRGTAARWLVVVAVLFLLPNTIAGAIGDETGFAPSPVQVTALLVVVAVALAAVNAVRQVVRPSVVVRLAVVPIVAVHAGWLLPAIWSQLGLAIAVISLVVAFLLLQPPAPRDNRAHSAALLTRGTLQLFGVCVAILAAPALLHDPSLIVLGLVWLSVVVVAALCFETVPRPSAAERDLERDVVDGRDAGDRRETLGE